MKLDDIIAKLKLRNLTPAVPTAEIDIQLGYVSDLLSDVLANAPRGGVLVTVQVHLNVLAVAVHAEQAAVIFALGRIPEKLVLDKATQEGVSLLVSDDPAFEIVGRLYESDVRGCHA